MKNIEYSVVIPVYNSGDWIQKLVDSIIYIMNTLGTYEIILVDDASPRADTWDKLKNICALHPVVTAIHLQYNAGQINALLCGMSHARGNYIITMDDDFQHNPKEIPTLISKIKETNCDCVIANFPNGKKSAYRRLGSKFSNILSEKMYNKPRNIANSSFRIMKRELAQTLTSYKGRHPQLGAMIFTVTQNVRTVMIEHQERMYGKSGYTVKRLVNETLNIIMNSGYDIFRIIFRIGLIGTLCSFVCLIISIFLTVFHTFYQYGVLYTLWIALIFLIQLIFLSFGLTGMYVKKISDEQIGFPAYYVREIYHGEGVNNYE